MSIGKNWLTEIRQNYEDYNWLDAHENEIYEIIERNNRPDAINDVIAALNLVAPYYLNRPDREKWLPQFDQILLFAMQTRDNKKKTHALYNMGRYKVVGSKPKSGVKAMEQAYSNAEREEEELEACLTLVRSLAFLSASNTGQPYYDWLIDYASNTRNKFVQGRIYTAAAQYHIAREEGIEAMSYAQTAYGFWKQYGDEYFEEDVHHIGYSLFFMALSARLMRQYDLVRQYLGMAEHYFDKLTTKRYKMLIEYERGNMAWTEGNHEAALSHFDNMLAFFEENNYPSYIALASYSKGVVLTMLGRYDDAEPVLQRSHMDWKDLRNTGNQANAEHALGFLYMKQGMREDAETWLHMAMETAQTMDDTPAKHHLIERIQEDIDKL